MKSETIDESKYPKTYEEFEKRVSELFLGESDSPKDLNLEDLLKEEKEDGRLRREYESACYYYDDPKSPDNDPDG